MDPFNKFLNDTPYDWTQRIRHSPETFSSGEDVFKVDMPSLSPCCAIEALSYHDVADYGANELGTLPD